MTAAVETAMQEMKLESQQEFKADSTYEGNTGPPMGVSTVGFRVGKVTPNQWQTINYEKYDQALLDREDAKRVRGGAQAVIKETDSLTAKNQAESTKKLRERLHDINFWKSELDREIVDMIDSVDSMKKIKKRLENALIACECPLNITTDNINCRNRRYGTDKVEDGVEIALLKEIDINNKVQALLKRTIEQVDKQIAIDYAAKERLEMDWSDKKEADEYDGIAANLTNGDTNKQFYPGAAHLNEYMSTPESWAQFTQDNIAVSEAERMASYKLKTLVESMLIDTSRDMREAADAVETELQKDVERLIDAKAQMEDNLRQTCQEIAVCEREVENIKAAIKRKDDPLKVAQTRLHVRSYRPNIELCNDPPQNKIIDEVGDISSSLDALIQQLNLQEASLKNLMDTRMMLEKQIQMNKNTIFINQQKCIPRRAYFPTVIRLQGYNN